MYRYLEQNHMYPYQKSFGRLDKSKYAMAPHLEQNLRPHWSA